MLAGPTVGAFDAATRDDAERGPPLGLLHGWPESWSAWREVVPALAEEHAV